MKIGLFTDSHYADIERIGTRRPARSYRKLEEACRAFRAEGADLVVCLGDLINATLDRDRDSANLCRIAALLKALPQPAVILPGNHDAEAFTAAEMGRLTGLPTSPAVLTAGGTKLLFVHANFTRDGTPYPIGPNDWTDANLPASALTWIERELIDCEAAVLFSHQPLALSCSAPEHLIRNAAPVRDILQTSRKVRRVYQGHYHPGDHTVIGGIAYTTLPAMCEGDRNAFYLIDLPGTLPAG